MQVKKAKEKEKLVQGILRRGFWQSKQQIREGVAKFKTKKEKVVALKLQLSQNLISTYIFVNVLHVS